MNNIKIYTLLEVVDILKVTRRSVYNYIKHGQLKAVKMGREWRVTEEDLKDFISKGTEEDYFKKIKESK